mmetsp:Transcript_52745/g.112577  ORF Transcript_52745/g.112577 Transcript_52745/m.112577 type:complete len:217 (+) Transcript_52745:216-866(+)
MPKTDTSYQPPVTLSTRPAKLSINQLMGTTLSASVAGGWHDKPSPCTPLQGLPNNKNSDEEVSGLMRPGTPTNCSQAAFWTTKNVSLQYRKQNPSKNSMHVAQEERNARCKIVKGRLDQHRRLNEERQLHSNGHTHTNTNTNTHTTKIRTETTGTLLLAHSHREEAAASTSHGGHCESSPRPPYGTSHPGPPCRGVDAGCKSCHRGLQEGGRSESC